MATIAEQRITAVHTIQQENTQARGATHTHAHTHKTYLEITDGEAPA